MLFTNNPEIEKSKLTERLNAILPETSELKMLVGFFYFSGFDEIFEAMRGNAALKIKVLVGMRAQHAVGQIAEADSKPHKGLSRKDILERFLAELRLTAESAISDTAIFEERARYFCEMLESGRMEIRKTAEPNHAKLYLFDTTNALLPKTWITGSSNFSREGLAGRHELDVEMFDMHYGKAQDYFDALWEKAAALTATPDDARRIVETVKRGATDVSPYEAYLRLVRLFLDTRERYETRSAREIIEGPKEPDGRTSRYTAFRYQTDAIRQADAILRRHGGVIIADVVGLGKSVVGSVLARVNADGARGIVIAPPGLVPAWNEYLGEFGLARSGWKALSRGKLDEIEDIVHTADGTENEYSMLIVDEAHWFRSEGTQAYETLWQICRHGKSGKTRKIVLMTATPFSNRPADIFALLKLFLPMRGDETFGDLDEKARRAKRVYEDVDYCRKNLKHFLAEQPPRGVPADEWKKKRERVAALLERLNIAATEFAGTAGEAEKKLKKRLRERLAEAAAEIREIVEIVMIRRNRLDLLENPDYSREVGERISKVENPQEQLYELSKKQSAFYDRVISEYFGENSAFSGAAYKPIDYTKEGQKTAEEIEDGTGPNDAGGQTRHTRTMQQRNMAKFVRRLLVRRFESSFGAFRKTLENLIESHGNVLKTAQEKGIVAVSAAAGNDLRKIFAEAAENSELALGEDFDAQIDELRERGEIYSKDTDFSPQDWKRFLADLRKDKKLLEEIRREVDALNLCGNDPKAAKLVEAVKKVLAGTHAGRKRKRPETPKRKVLVFSEFADTAEIVAATLEKALPGRVLRVSALSNEMRRKIAENFDANAGVKDADEYDVLVATDRISEGFNLNRAGVVINYDIPWNPVRVIQRVGRINRIGQKIFDSLFIFNFFPTERGNEITKQRTIAQNKMFMIHTSIGEDSKIFSEDEEPTPARMYERLTTAQGETPSFYTRMLRVWTNAEKETPEIAARVRDLPMHVKTAWQKEQGAAAGLYLFAARREAGEDVPAVLYALRIPAEARGGNAAPAVTRVLFERALEDIACAPGTPAAERSERFWDDYKKMKDALSAPPDPLPDGPNSLTARAAARLEAEREHVNCGAEDGFAEDILRDIRTRRTLPERTLSRIAEAGRGKGEFEKFLADLHRKIGALSFRTSELPDPECLVAEELFPPPAGEI